MTEKRITCIVCPTGCDILVRCEREEIESVQGHSCRRGEEYARNEASHPQRILTSTAKVEGAAVPLVPLRSSAPVPKNLVFACIEEVRRLRLKAPVRCHEVLIANVLGCGVDIIATGSVEAGKGNGDGGAQGAPH